MAIERQLLQKFSKFSSLLETKEDMLRRYQNFDWTAEYLYHITSSCWQSCGLSLSTDGVGNYSKIFRASWDKKVQIISFEYTIRAECMCVCEVDTIRGSHWLLTVTGNYTTSVRGLSTGILFWAACSFPGAVTPARLVCRPTSLLLTFFWRDFQLWQPSYSGFNLFSEAGGDHGKYSST